MIRYGGSSADTPKVCVCTDDEHSCAQQGSVGGARERRDGEGVTY